MKKNIKGTQMKLIVMVGGEFINDYVNVFRDYFTIAGHHISDYHENNKDTILFYSYFPGHMDCRGCKKTPIDIHINKDRTDKFGPGFFDIKREDMPCEHVSRIYYGTTLIGFYCQNNNVLSMCDIPHSPGNQAHLKKILDKMVEVEIIHKIEPIVTKRVISLGADPEMESIVNGERVPATSLIQLSNREKVYISHDGHTQPQRELRPDPGATPEELVENIRDLIKVSSFFGEELSVVGSSCPLGGHIHIGNASPCAELTDVLDYFLFPFLQFNSTERKKSKYGKPGDVRVQPHGFEYRTPPPAWLLTPSLALKTLQLTKRIVENIINNIDVEISDNYDWSEYKENLKSIGFPDTWIEEFDNEIKWAVTHLDTPLAKLWGVEIPKEYQIKNNYRYVMPIAPPRRHPFPFQPIPAGVPIEINMEDLNEIEEEEIE